jgi:hypothetical protein
MIGAFEWVTHAPRVTELIFSHMSEPCWCGEFRISSRAGLLETEDGGKYEKAFDEYPCRDGSCRLDVSDESPQCCW